MKFKKHIKNITLFFPVQLLSVHFKRNYLLILSWLFIWGFIFDIIAAKFGASNLFLTPEYLGNVDYKSFFILGLSLGGFIITFNISSYIINGYRFPFIATLHRPFYKYTINNFIIPLIFISVFIWKSINYQINYEQLAGLDIALNIISLIVGILSFILISFLYFFRTNKDITSILKAQKNILKAKKISKPINKILEKDKEWKKQMSTNKSSVGRWRIETYLNSKFKITKPKSLDYYTPDNIHKVLNQNHFNASVYGLFIILIITTLAIFNNIEILNIPASASILLFANLLIIFYSLFHFLFKEWGVFISAFVIILLITYPRENFLNHNDSAYGMTYNKEDIILEDYKNLVINNYKSDYDSTIKTLENWKKKNTIDGKLPKIIFVNTSGGGSKAMMWTYRALAYADSATDGNILNKTFLITGASGGMIGAAYLREIYLQNKNTDNNIYDEQFINNLSKDILNPIVFSMFLRDWFFNFQKFKYSGNKYYKDRAYLFEKSLNENTNNVFDKPLSYYKDLEKQAEIPLIILAPTIVNMGKKLLISPQGISYMVNYYKEASNIEFKKFYKDYNPDSLRFSTALRMNATFPYISPVITLPGKPRLNIMDAAISDNYGLSTSLQFLYAFKSWINKNTSGIIFIEVTEESKNISVNNSIFDEFALPLSNIYDNLFSNQNFNNQNLIHFTQTALDKDIDFVYFNLDEGNAPISLSWHLTKQEKNIVKNSVNSTEYQEELERLKKLLEQAH